MNSKKSISIIFLIVFFFCKQGFCKDIIIGTLLPKQKRFELILKGMKTKFPALKTVDMFKNNRAKPNLIIAYEKYLSQAKKFKKPVFLLTDNELIVNTCKKPPFVKMVVLLSAPLARRITTLKKTFNYIKTFSVVVGDNLLYNYLKSRHIKALKVFFAKNMGDVPYKIDKALKSADALIAIPSPVVFNYFSTQLILKKAILAGKPVIGFSEDMLQLGAYAVIIPDYFAEGCKICTYIKYFLNNRKTLNKVITPTAVKVIVNRNFK